MIQGRIRAATIHRMLRAYDSTRYHAMFYSDPMPRMAYPGGNDWYYAPQFAVSYGVKREDGNGNEVEAVVPQEVR